MRKQLNILVTGATGHQGSHVVRALLARGHRVRALTREPGRLVSSFPSARIEVVSGRFEDSVSMAAAARGADAVFLMSSPKENGPEGEVRGGVNALNAFASTGSRFILFSSVGGADRQSEVPQFESKFRIEQHLRKLGVPFAIVAPTNFMENYLDSAAVEFLQTGELVWGLTSDRPLQLIALRNLADVAVEIFENAPSFDGSRWELASDELTMGGVAEVLSAQLGRSLHYRYVRPRAKPGATDDRGTLLRFLEHRGYEADIPGLRRRFPRIRWLSFHDWAAEQTWPVPKPESETRNGAPA